MSVIEIIKDLKAAGVRLEEHGDELWCTPPESMTPELVERVKDHKGELLAILRKAAADLAAAAVWQQTVAELDGDPLFPPDVIDGLRHGRAKWDPCLSIADVGEILAKRLNWEHPTISRRTIERWIYKGVPAPGSDRLVFLDHKKLPNGRIRFTPQDVERFATRFVGSTR
ncbi:MAG: hypothetical protein CMJ75_07905 [Planctomycetaceae bacterium]|nr:hypothetical protein [Planctomycetaceae bacterium]